MTDAAVAVGVEKMTHASNPRITESLNSAMDNRADAPSGLTFPGLFGMAYRLHAQRYGTTRDQVSYSRRRWAMSCSVAPGPISIAIGSPKSRDMGA